FGFQQAAVQQAGFHAGLPDARPPEAELPDEPTPEHSPGEDHTPPTQTRFGLGCRLDQPDVANPTFGRGARAFGHPGAGGPVGFADPEHDVAFGFV
ncbi:serine hydrolase, partial [Pseudomonas faucium]|uniref:serine hydrolase n=1 Tax=Pseudomonas faucium TaxID=2740518 RepID=UPI001596A569